MHLKTVDGHLRQKSYRVFCVAEARTEYIHSHDFFELAYVYEGCGRHIGDHSKMVNEGDFLLILPGAWHCTVSNEKDAPWVRVCNYLATMEFLFKVCDSCKKIIGSTELFDILTNGEPTCLILHDDKNGSVQNIMRSMLDEYAANDAATPYTMENLFENLLIAINRIYERKKHGIAEESRTARNIHLIKSYIKSHLHEKLTLDLIAAQLHYSPEYFSRYFKKATGKNITEYLTAIRIDKAKELLKTTDLPINDISYSCGYSSVSNFRSHFAKYCGMSPKEYRNEK